MINTWPQAERPLSRRRLHVKCKSKMLPRLSVSQVHCKTAIFCRFYGKHNKKYLYKDGKKYNNIIYYPRNPDHEDPPVNPSKLFLVQRIKPVKGNPFWEKRLLRDLGLDGPAADFTVVKNIPEVNSTLWKIKHLIKVTPITFPYGEPTENDIEHTFVNDNGECIVTKQLIDPKKEESLKNFQEDPKRLDGETLRKDSRLKWLNPL